MFQKIIDFIWLLKQRHAPEAKAAIKIRRLVSWGNIKAFRLFRDDKFRKLVNFSRISQLEQDRIFNELTATNLIMLMLLLDQLIQDAAAAKKEDKEVGYRAMRQVVSEYFMGYMKSLGIEKKHLKVWRKLIDLRYDEYVQGTDEARQVFLEHQDMADLAEYKIIAVFQALIFGLCNHIMRGKIKNDDPLYKFIEPYLLYVHKGYLERL